MNVREARPGLRVVWRVRRGRGFMERAGVVQFVASARRLCVELDRDAVLIYADAANVEPERKSGGRGA